MGEPAPTRTDADAKTVDLAWPRERLPEALELIFRRRLPASAAVPRPAAPGAPGPDAFVLWMEACAEALRLRAEPIASAADEIVDRLPRRGLLLLALGGSERYLLLRRAGRALHLFVAPGRWITRPLTFFHGLGGAGPAGSPAAALGLALGLDPERTSHLAAVLAGGRRTPAQPLAGWLLLPDDLLFGERARQVGARRLAVVALGGSLGHLLLFLAGWGLVGGLILQGRFEPAWLAAWLLLLPTLVALRAWAQLASGRLAISLGALMRERLLEGILRFDLGQVKERGLGFWFGAVLEVEALEALARGGGHQAILSLLQLLLAAGLFALALGPGPALLLGLLGLALIALFVAWYWRTLERWTEARLGLTHELCEKILGYRTLVSQLAPAQRHRGEDQALLEYERIGARLHDRLALLQVAVPRGFLVLGLGLLTWLLLPERRVGGTAAVALGGLLAGTLAIRRLVTVAPILAGAAVAFARIRPIFAAGADRQPPPSLAAAEVIGSAAGERPTLVADKLSFRHPGRSEPVLREASFAIQRGERVLIQGPSGSGKSTMASLLSGLRTPSSGILLYRGIDHHSLGLPAWRRQVALVPQFHENHLLSAPLLFNLLLARRWPPLPADIQAAEEVCRALGLDKVLAKMPAGLGQMVGDSGWQLSHGEQSRVFVARALLQQADVHILDEALAAVDPETGAAMLTAILARVETLVAVHHD